MAQAPQRTQTEINEEQPYSEWTHHTCFHCGHRRLMKRSQYICKFCEDGAKKKQPATLYRLHGLRRIRRRVDMTQDMLSVRSGVNRTTIGRAERGLCQVRPPTAKKLADALATTVTALVRKQRG